MFVRTIVVLDRGKSSERVIARAGAVLRSLVVATVFAASIGTSHGLRADVEVITSLGFEVTPIEDFDPSLPFELQPGGLAVAPDGVPIVYVRGAIRRLESDGDRVLAAFDPPVYGSFIAVDPDGTRLIFGESSNGGLWSIPIGGGRPELIATLAQSYDSSWAPPGSGAGIEGSLFISAPGPTTESNSIWMLRPGEDPPLDEIVGGIPVFSGPIAFDPSGNLYSITSSFEPAPRLIRFPASMLSSGVGATVIDGGDAEEILSGLPGAYDLEWIEGRLVASNLGFVSGEGSIEFFDPARGFEVESFAAFRFDAGIASPTFLSVRKGHGFLAGEGRLGGGLFAIHGDFATLSRLIEITPELHFVRGEINGDANMDISDAVGLLGYLFLGESTPPIVEAADVNGSGAVDIADPVYLLDFLFRGGEPPPAPFPERGPAPRVD
jgi:hypothetical protein